MKRPTTRLSRSIQKQYDSVNSSHSTKKHQEHNSVSTQNFFKNLPYLHSIDSEKDHFLSSAKILEEKIQQISDMNNLFFLNITRIFQFFFQNNLQQRIFLNKKIDNFDEALLNLMYGAKKNISDILQNEILKIKDFFNYFLSYKENEEYKKKSDFRAMFGSESPLDQKNWLIRPRNPETEQEILKKFFVKKYPEEVIQRSSMKKNHPETHQQTPKSKQYSSMKKETQMSPTLFNTKGVSIFHTKFSHVEKSEKKNPMNSIKKPESEQIKTADRDIIKEEEVSLERLTVNRRPLEGKRPGSNVTSNKTKSTHFTNEKSDLVYSKHSFKEEEEKIDNIEKNPENPLLHHHQQDYQVTKDDVISFRKEDMRRMRRNDSSHFDRQRDRLRLWNEDESYLEKRLMGIRIEKQKVKEKQEKARNERYSSEKIKKIQDYSSQLEEPKEDENIDPRSIDIKNSRVNDDFRQKFTGFDNRFKLSETEKFEEFQQNIEQADSSLTDLHEDKSENLTEEKKEKFIVKSEDKIHDNFLQGSKHDLTSLKSSITNSTISNYKEAQRMMMKSSGKQNVSMYNLHKSHAPLPRGRMNRNLSMIQEPSDDTSELFNRRMDREKRKQQEVIFQKKSGGGGKLTPRQALFKIEKKMVSDPTSEGKFFSFFLNSSKFFLKCLKNILNFF